jgi:hypothetical protein
MGNRRIRQILNKRLAMATTVVVGVGTMAVGLSGTAGARGNDRNDESARAAKCITRANDGETRRRLNVVGLTADGRVVCFDERRPGEARSVGAVSGLKDNDTALVGIDYRPATGELIGLGNGGGVYSIDPTTAAATKKSQLNTALSGASFGADFNPTVDRLRVVSDTGQNLRVNVDTGEATTDAGLNYSAGMVATGVVGAAYTNNDADPSTGTTLFDIDANLDQVVIQAPPNAGSLNVTGKLGVDTVTAVGFDIHSTVRDGTTVDVRALASLTTGSQSGLYEINLLTGKAASRGSFAAAVIDIAIPLNQL